MAAAPTFATSWIARAYPSRPMSGADQLEIKRAEFAARRARLLEHAPAGFVLFDDKYIQYFTGFNFLATERPVAVICSEDSELVAFVPEFEVERTEEEADFDRVESYPEYPG